MRGFEPALPRLQEAHRLMWEVREVCGDDAMRQSLAVSMDANQDAQARVNAIAREAREVHRG